ncbi:MAG: GNAT family N-acetyltransferase [Proteobacteria bacterium]|nr:GNAT family N-acetyltransferase [Pseudomonadota bacterium]
MSESLEIRQFNLREADWTADREALQRIRRQVFILEQGVPRDIEWDGRDEECWHWLATDVDDKPIGTGRLMPEGQIGRMAVLEDWRGHGVGAAILEAAVEKARHLGMTEALLHAQSHAVNFYEKAGFAPQGDEYLEAGIPHLTMTRSLSPPVDNIQRRTAVKPEFEMSVKPFDTAEVLWSEHHRPIRQLRRRVFVNELKLPDFQLEDETDDKAIHWIAENDDSHVIGTIRMTGDGHISRLAVQDNFRGTGIGATLLELAIQRGRRFALTDLTATAESGNGELLQARGFEQTADGWHLALEPEDRDVERRELQGASLDGDVTYQLGVDRQMILLRSESDFANVIMEMARQARQYIRIYSPYLAHELFDRTELRDICSNLARRNRYTRVEILIFDPHRVFKNGHALLNISRRLPSSIGIKIVDPEMRQQNHEYVIVDGEGLIYRQEVDNYEGYACFHDITESNRLNRQFTASWESGLLDPNLRQLRI